MYKKILILVVSVFCLIPITHYLLPSLQAVEEAPVFIRWARPLGMGGAFLAVTDDQNSFFYNPAGIMLRKDFLLTLVEMPIQISDDMKKFYDFYDANKTDLENFDTLSEEKQKDLMDKIIKNISKYRVRLTIGLPNVSLIPKRGRDSNFGVGLFTVLDLRSKVNSGVLIPTIDLWGSVDGAAFLAYARRFEVLDRNIYAGANLKIIARGKFDEKRKSILAFTEFEPKAQVGKGFGADLGLIAEVSRQWRAGLMIRDLLNTKIKYEEITSSGERKPGTTGEIPRAINVGATYKPLNLVTFAVDINDITNGKLFKDEFFTKLHLGAEVGWRALKFRAGFNQGYPSIGIGIYTPLLLDIEYAYYSDELGRYAGQVPETNHMFSLALRF